MSTYTFGDIKIKTMSIPTTGEQLLDYITKESFLVVRDSQFGSFTSAPCVTDTEAENPSATAYKEYPLSVSLYIQDNNKRENHLVERNPETVIQELRGYIGRKLAVPYIQYGKIVGSTYADITADPNSEYGFSLTAIHQVLFKEQN